MKYLGLDGVQVGLGSQMTNLTRRRERIRERTRPAVGNTSGRHVNNTTLRGRRLSLLYYPEPLIVLHRLDGGGGWTGALLVRGARKGLKLLRPFGPTA